MEKTIIKKTKKKVCDRCKINEADVETERGFYLCFSCDSERLSCVNNTENPKTEEEFFEEMKKARN